MFIAAWHCKHSKNGGCPWRWRASRSHSRGFYLRSCVLRNILCLSMSDTLPRCLLALLLVCIVWWSGRILGEIEVVLTKNNTCAHVRTYLFDDNSNALGLIQSRWSSRCVHTRELTNHFRASLKHKDDGQTKFIKPNSQRQDIIIKYWVSIASIHREQGWL